MDQNDNEQFNDWIADHWQAQAPKYIALSSDLCSLLANDSPTEDQLDEAIRIAHKLAGNLGMFGKSDESSMASDIEENLISKHRDLTGTQERAELILKGLKS